MLMNFLTTCEKSVADPTKEWLGMVRDCLELASRGTRLVDFKESFKIRTSNTGQTYFDRLRVAESLIDEGVISIVNECIIVSAAEIPSWLAKALTAGEQISVELLDLIDPSGGLASKYDFAAQVALGLAGELHVLSELYRLLPHREHSRIKHVAATDDTRGYDIEAPSIRDVSTTLRLEVKVMGRLFREFRFFISANEARVGRARPDWRLVAATCVAGEFQILGFLYASQFENYLPVDTSRQAQWQSARVLVHKDEFAISLP